MLPSPAATIARTEAELLRNYTILTITGRTVSLRDPRPETIALEDIAGALARLCRYSGHVRGFYSVAEHSWHCSRDPRVKTRAEAAAMLMHDAAEAYVGDITSPLKKLMRAHHATDAAIAGETDRPAPSCFDLIEERFASVIAERFGLVEYDYHAVDLSMCMREQQDLRNLPDGWKPIVRPAEMSGFYLWTPEQAEQVFLRRAEELGVR